MCKNKLAKTALIGCFCMSFGHCHQEKSIPSFQAEDLLHRAEAQEQSCSMEDSSQEFKGIHIKETRMRPTRKDHNSAAYMVLENTTDQPVTLTQATFNNCKKVEIHESKEEKGIHTMRPLTSITIPPKGSVTLKPGGLHIMLIKITKTYHIGDTADLTLSFKELGDVTIPITVKKCCKHCH